MALPTKLIFPALVDSLARCAPSSSVPVIASTAGVVIEAHAILSTADFSPYTVSAASTYTCAVNRSDVCRIKPIASLTDTPAFASIVPKVTRSACRSICFPAESR